VNPVANEPFTLDITRKMSMTADAERRRLARQIHAAAERFSDHLAALDARHLAAVDQPHIDGVALCSVVLLALDVSLRVARLNAPHDPELERLADKTAAIARSLQDII